VVAAATVGTILLAAVGCRPLSGAPIQALDIGPALLARNNGGDLAAGVVVDATTKVFTPVRVDVEHGTVTELPTLGAGSFNAADDLTDAGITVGTVRDGTANVNRMARWDPAHGDALELVPDLGGGSTAGGISEHGVITGSSTPAGGSSAHAFTYDPATNAVADLGQLDGGATTVNDINDAGLVVGSSQEPGPPGTSRAWVFDPAVGHLVALPAPPTGFPDETAWAIDESGRYVVGEAFSNDQRAAGSANALAGVGLVFDRQTGRTIVLDPFGGHRTSATDVNDRGIVVGSSWDTDGVGHGFAYDIQTGRVVDLGSITGHEPTLFINDHLHVVGSEIDFDPPRQLFAVSSVLRTSPDAPAAPSVSGCDGSVRIGWAPPAFDGNDAVTTYVVQRDGQTIATVGATVSGVEETLPVGTTATYTVTAANGQGYSSGSATTSFTSSACA
jgi:probable HAF family extracellular repeat protein